MKIKIDKDLLLDKLQKAIKFVPTSAVIPAMLNFKFTITGNVMEIMAQGDNSQIKIYCPVTKSDGDMSFCVPAKLFYHDVRLLDENEITITKKEPKGTGASKFPIIEIKNGKSKHNITCDTMPEFFPVMEMKESVSEALFQQWYLKLALKSTERFVDDGSMKFNADGINIEEIDNKMIFTGISGRNMMCRVNVPPISIARWDSIVISTDTASKVFDMLGDKGEICVCHNPDRIVFFTDGDDKYEIMSLVKNSKFPPSESIFKTCPKNNLTINAAEFKRASQRLKLFAADVDSLKKISINSNPENMNEIIMQSIDTFSYKDGEEILTVQNPTGVPVNKVFNANDLLEVLSVFEESEFDLHHDPNYKIPCQVSPRSQGNEVSNFNFIICAYSE